EEGATPPSGRVSTPLPSIRAINVVIPVSFATGSGPAAAGAVRRGSGGRGRCVRGTTGPAARGERAHGGGDVAAAGGNQPPLRAEAAAALPAGHPRARVAGEVVQRVPVVRHLLGAVRTGDRAQVTGLRAA